ncbi:MAG: exonuclease domain-containing protein [Patescibacteria group bacterium]|nr:exonuclease domain-containing protein [Patescibacteria group bacterium]
MKNYIVLDFETSGLEPRKDVIIEIAALKVQDGQVIDTINSLVNPEREISPVVQSVTGITNEILADAPKVAAVIDQLRDFCGDLPIVGHNVEFDRSFLRAVSDDLAGPTIDTFFLAQVLLPQIGSYSLNSLAKSLGFSHENAHRALGDVLANKSLLEALDKQASDLDEHAKKQMVDTIRKSAIPQYGDWLEAVLDSKSELPKTEYEARKYEISLLSNETREQLDKIWKSGEKIIAETYGIRETDWIQFLAKQNNQSVFVCREYAFLKQLFADDKRIYFLEEGNFALNLDKFKHLLLQNKFTDAEARVIWKILAFGNENRAELRIGGADEFRVWERIAQSNVIDFESKAPLMVISQKAFYNVLNFGQNRDTLVISDTPSLLDAHDITKRISLHDGVFADTEVEPVVKEFFVNAGKFFTYTEDGKFPTTIVLNNYFWQNPEHHALLSLFIKLQEDLQKFDSAFADSLSVFMNQDLTARPEYLPVVWIWPDGRLSFQATPIDVQRSFLPVVNAFDKVVCGLATKFAGSILRYLGGLSSEDWPGISADHRPFSMAECYLHHSDTEKKDDAFLESGLLSAVSGWLKTDERCLLVLCNSVHMAEKNFLTIEGLLKKTGMHKSSSSSENDEAKIAIFGEGMSGGRRKILDSVADSSGRKILVCRYEFLPEIELYKSEWKTIIISKFIFDPPSQPLLQIRAKLFDNSFEQFTVPRMLLRLFRSMPRSIERIICLDHGLIKDWAEAVLSALGVGLQKKNTEELGKIF